MWKLIVLFGTFVFIARAGAGPTGTGGGSDSILFQGDIYLTKEEFKELKAAEIKGTSDDQTLIQGRRNGGRFRTGGLVNKNSRWPNDIIYYGFHSNFPESWKKTVRKALSNLQDKLSGCLKIQEKRNRNRVEVEYDPDNILCESAVGYKSGRQHFVLSDWCLKNIGDIQHEFIHAAGVWHTQMRWDRDEYVTILEDNIEDGELDQFRKYERSKLNHYGLPYDYRSIMHYNQYAFSKVRGDLITIKTKDPSKQNLIGQADSPSKGDIQLLQHMYGCLKGCTATRNSISSKCVFPFKSKNVSYNGCTEKDSTDGPWCATAVKDNGNYTKWGYCEDFCPVHRDCKTTTKKRCVFPFKYKGRKYNACAPQANNEDWCATDVDANGNYIGKWGNCGSLCPFSDQEF